MSRGLGAHLCFGSQQTFPPPLEQKSRFSGVKTSSPCPARGRREGRAPTRVSHLPGCSHSLGRPAAELERTVCFPAFLEKPTDYMLSPTPPHKGPEITQVFQTQLKKRKSSCTARGRGDGNVAAAPVGGQDPRPTGTARAGDQCPLQGRYLGSSTSVKVLCHLLKLFFKDK